MDPNAPLDIRFSCPECGIALILPRESRRTEGPCPQCGVLVRAPEPARTELPPRRGQGNVPGGGPRLRVKSGSPGFLYMTLDDVREPDRDW